MTPRMIKTRMQVIPDLIMSSTKKHPSAPINESGLIQMIRMGKFIRLIRVNTGSDITVYKRRC